MPHVITITGPSGAGKSTLLRYLQQCADKSFIPKIVPKFTTRPKHVDDQNEVICVKKIPAECDLIYEQYGARYGLELAGVLKLIEKGQSPIVILNDVRAVEDVRNALGRQVKSVFIFMESPTLPRFRELAHTKGLVDEKGEIDEEELQRRFLKAQDIYRIYIEHIHLFDHVIINNRTPEDTIMNDGAFEDLKLQVKQIVRGLEQDQNWPLQIESQKIPVQRLFVIFGSPGSGKDLLIRAVNDLGIQHAQIVPKHTSRKRWADDGNEMICPGDDDYDFDKCDIVYENYGDEYGIKSAEIWEGLGKGIFQVVVVSNIGAINKLSETFGKLVVLVYVHSEINAAEYQSVEEKYGKDPKYVERRVAEYEFAFKIYLGNVLAFNHVLIYSGLEEDLYDQIFRLFRAYELDLGHAATKPLALYRVWKQMVSYKPITLIGKRE